MIGEIWSIKTQYYDKATKKHGFKSRPALVIGQADASDYVVLPVSTIPNRNNVDCFFDIFIDPVVYPLLNLKNESYIRTHKQTVVNRGDMSKLIGRIVGNYNDLYLEILEKREAFNRRITDQAI